MNFDNKDCVQVRKDKVVSVNESARVFKVLNPDEIEVRQIEVDGCLINDNVRQRCDWLFEVDTQNRVIYVELKGNDLEKAFAQLMATMKYLKVRHRDKMKEGHIVASKVSVPRFKKWKVDKKKKMMSKHRATLVIHSDTNKEGLRLDKRPYKS